MEAKLDGFPLQARTVLLAGLVLLVCLTWSARVSAQEPGPEPEGSVPFTRGDVNADGRRSISDAVMVERYLFFGDRAPPCFDGAPAPPEPFPSEGEDPTADDLPCFRSTPR